jgi:hypothetical protein
MTDLDIVRWIRGLDENGAVGLARSLIFAEAGLHGLPLDQFTMSGRVKARDQGIDGRTDFPAEVGERMPTGPCIWQVKSGETRPSAATEFDAAKRDTLIDAIAHDGYDYVLFWANDPVDERGKDVRSEFTEAVKRIRDTATVHFLFTEAIERLCYAHLGVLAQASPYPLGGLVNLPRWGAPQKFGDVTFQPDERRSQAIEALLSHASRFDMEPSELHVFGDTGVGKSRLVYEALDADGIRERVLVAPDASQFDRGLLTLVANSADRRLVVVVDDCDAADRLELARYTGMAEGRIRLITVGSRWTREPPSIDSRRIEVLPLEASASRQIAQSVGLGDADADLVAEYTEGYPGVALVLSRAIRYGAPGEALVDRVRGQEEIGMVLDSFLAEADRPLLGVLGLFEKLGFEGDLSQECTLVCRTLEIDETEFRRVVDQELGRFVSAAGRFRRVTPRLFAVWLATRLLAQNKDALRDAMSKLPESLRDRILTQMRDFAGDPVVEEVLADILEQHPFLDGTLGDVDEGASRLLHVAAIAAPEAAMRAIKRLTQAATIDELQHFGPGRREMVWALEVLLWFDSTFDRAADALLRLAVTENETWSNSATGVLQGVFRVHLGGSGTPYSHRLAWARHVLERDPLDAPDVLVPGLGLALELHESRSTTEFGGRTAPLEWRPQDISQEVEARAGAWDLMIDVANTSDIYRDLVAVELAQGLRTALRRGLTDRVRGTLAEVEWSARGRSVIGDAIAKVLEYETDMPAPTAEDLRRLYEQLLGQTLRDRIDFVLSSTIWKLAAGKEEALSGRPRVVAELAAQLRDAGREVQVETAARSANFDQQTTTVLFEEVGRHETSDDLLTLLEALDPLPEAALLGLLRGHFQVRGDAWADSTLDRWLRSRGLGGLVIRGARTLPATDQRAEFAIAAVEAQASPPAELRLFLYGAWTKALSQELLLRIISALRRSDDPQDVEHALGILDQWVEDREDLQADDALVEVALELTRSSSELSDRYSPMLSLYRSQLVHRLPVSFDDRMEILTDVLYGLDSFPDAHDLEIADELSRERPRETAERVIQLIVDGTEAGSTATLWLEDAKILSRIEEVGGAGAVVELIDSLPPQFLHVLVGHVAFNRDDPDPLVKRLIELGDSERLWSLATFKFMYPESAWTGPESAYLRGRLAAAQRWREQASEDTRMRQWLDELIEGLDENIVRAERAEAERGY